ncbi:hypothetical protein [Fibrivirga algicola]|uniref:Uncharacterized protein n=1 Tax=Fibrivirga algicola TaxID=2950420 RepID=A0ABX0QCL5_9BACT|nr:hypothetical protein [Fibrivirga algicola]ARK10683.1 hypothetical protein A6C57_10275 [Fibrella sp. ES10-3-2-2]NID10100.1 hypothetical protein [Fibrivirga algicola]
MNDLLSRLPEYEPRPGLWNRIEADLESDERLAQVINELPDFEPETDLWARIDDALLAADQISDETPVRTHPAVESAPIRRLGQRLGQVRWMGIGVAAACLLMLGTWVFRYSASQPVERIEYTVEQQTEWTPADAEPATDSPADQRAEEFINRQCEEAALACQRPEVRELRAQLGELSVEQQRLAAERERFGHDPTLVQAQVKIENQRADVTKELITLLRS